MCSLPPSAWPTGAASVSASSITSAWAPRTPAPQKSVAVLAALSASASARTCASLGTTSPAPAAITLVPVSCVASSAARSPGSASTETPPRPSAVWIAIRSTRGICSGVEISSQ